MLDPTQVKTYIIRPVCQALGLGGPLAEDLVLGTWLKESVEGSTQFIRQLNNGPAHGVGMMEEPTAVDITDRFLKLPQNSALNDVVNVYRNGLDTMDQLYGNLHLMAAMTRIRYFMVKAALPAHTAQGMCLYWKKYYNTELGKGVPDAGTVACWTRAMQA